MREDSGRKAHLSTVASAKVEVARKTQGKPEWEKRRVGEGEKGRKKDTRLKAQDAGHRENWKGRKGERKIKTQKRRRIHMVPLLACPP